MQGVQKLKCTSCGTMFMSETGTTMCPSCSEQNHEHREQESSNMTGGSAVVTATNFLLVHESCSKFSIIFKTHSNVLTLIISLPSAIQDNR